MHAKAACHSFLQIIVFGSFASPPLQGTGKGIKYKTYFFELGEMTIENYPFFCLPLSLLLPLRSSWISPWMLLSQRAKRSECLLLETAVQPQPSYTMHCPHCNVSEQPGAGCSNEHVLVPVHATGWCAPSLPWASLPPTLSSGLQPRRTAEDGHKGAVICSPVPTFLPSLGQRFPNAVWGKIKAFG